MVFQKEKSMEKLNYSRLKIISPYGTDKRGNKLQRCKCVCGNIIIVKEYNLKSGNTRSCGCYRIFTLHKWGKIWGKKGLAHLNHGDARKGKLASEYRCWQSMKARCLNSNTEYYAYYGGRGIKICKKWLNSYEIFLNDMGRKPSNQYSLDRINVNGNYTPKNCRWATWKEQRHNRRDTKKKGVWSLK